MADSWWDEIDDPILEVLAVAGGHLPVADIAPRVGMSEAAVCSVLAILAQERKIRFATVELIPSGRRPGNQVAVIERGQLRTAAGIS